MAFEEGLQSISLTADASLALPTGVSNLGAGGFPSASSVGIASIAFSSPTVTVTTAYAHNYIIGDTVVIAGATASGNNGTFTVATITGATTFTLSNSNGVAQAAAGGTVTKRAASTAGYQYRFVKVTSGLTVGLCSANNDNSIGVLQSKPQVTGQAVTVGLRGVSFVVAGAAVTAGDKVMPDTSGRAVTLTGSNTFAGTALAAASAAGELIPVLIKG